MKKILSIDGGGIKGVFPAALLASIEDILSVDVGEYFDLIVGTSTGGIIALGLGMGMTAREILTFYEDLGPSVFQGNKLARFIRQLGIAKYDSGPLHNALERQFGNKRLGESRTRLVVPSVNLVTGEVHIYKTAHHQRLATDHKISVVDVAMATSAAPTYFPTYISASGLPLVDGGVYANNPAGLAAVEALSMLNWPTGDFQILSLGCTGSALDIDLGGKFGWGSGYWMRKIVSVMMTAQSSASTGTAQHLAGHENVIRLSPLVAKGKFALDAIDQIESLKGLGTAEARKAIERLTPLFSQKAEPFTPFHKL